MPVPTLEELFALTRTADLATADADRSAKEVGQAQRRAARKADEASQARAKLAEAKAAYEKVNPTKKA